MKKNKLRTFVYLAAGIIFIALVISYLVGWMGEFPLRNAETWTGRIAFIFLLGSLSITPLRTITGSVIIGPMRKALGLSAFYFAVAHVLILILLDYHLNFTSLIEAIPFRSYVLPGATAFLILTVLAVTSISKLKKTLRTAWKKIHMLVYLAGVLVLVHFTWIQNGSLVPSGEIKLVPLLAALYLAALFTLRFKPVREAIVRRRTRPAADPDAAVQ